MLTLHTRSFQKKMLSNLTCILIYSLTECDLEDVLKCSGSFVKFAKNIHDGVYC